MRILKHELASIVTIGGRAAWYIESSAIENALVSQFCYITERQIGPKCERKLARLRSYGM